MDELSFVLFLDCLLLMIYFSSFFQNFSDQSCVFSGHCSQTEMPNLNLLFLGQARLKAISCA